MLDKFTGDPVGGEVPTGTSAPKSQIFKPYADYGHGQTEPGLQDASLDAYMMFAPGVGAIGKGIKGLGKLATETVLKDAYKVNPLAFKPNPESAYRMIGGKEGYLDAVNSGEIRAMENGIYGDAHFNMGLPLNPNRLSSKELIKAGSPGGYKGPYMVERRWADNAWNKHTMTDAFKDSPEIQEELIKLGKDKDVWGKYGNLKTNGDAVRLYKEHWLQGYKEMPKYPGGGKVEPVVFTEDSPEYRRRLRAYNDSLNLYNSTSKVLSTLSDWNNSPTDKNKEKYWAAQEFNMNGDRENWVKGKRIKSLDETNAPWTKQNAPDGNPDFYYNYKKPVQPVEYQAPTQQQKKVVAKPNIRPDLIRTDGTTKGHGFLGDMPNAKEGTYSSELSISTEDVKKGKEVLIPTMVPTLNQEELNHLLTNKFNPQGRHGLDSSVAAKAIDFARNRDKQGKPYFALPNEEGKFKIQEQPQVQQQPIIQEQPPVINKDTIYQTPVMHQGYRNWQNGIKPGLYAEGGNIDYDYRWDNGLPRAINRAAYRKGGRVLPRYEIGGFHLPATNNTLNNLQNNTPGKSGTGANTAGTQTAPDYTNAAIGVGGALVGAAAELIPGVTHTDADGNVTSSRKSIGAEVLGDAAQGASMGMVLGPWGALAGAGLGAIYGGVKGVMNKNAADAADAKAEAERQNRITNNTIRNGPKTYTGQSVNTGSTFIAREGGNVPNDNFDYSAGGEFSNTNNNVIHAPEMGGYFIKRK